MTRHHHEAASAPAHAAQRSSDEILNRETDARFWAQTGYKVGQKLDMANPADRAMSKAWQDFNAKVRLEDAQGKLVVTYTDPAVQQKLREAEAAGKLAGDHLDQAVNATDAKASADSIKNATVAANIGTQRAREAASRQPPTGSPKVVHDAAVEAHEASGQPAPAPPPLAEDHPAVDHPNAQPSPNVRDIDPWDQPDDPNAPQAGNAITDTLAPLNAARGIAANAKDTLGLLQAAGAASLTQAAYLTQGSGGGKTKAPTNQGRGQRGGSGKDPSKPQLDIRMPSAGGPPMATGEQAPNHLDPPDGDGSGSDRGGGGRAGGGSGAGKKSGGGFMEFLSKNKAVVIGGAVVVAGVVTAAVVSMKRDSGSPRTLPRGD